MYLQHYTMLHYVWYFCSSGFYLQQMLMCSMLLQEEKRLRHKIPVNSFQRSFIEYCKLETRKPCSLSTHLIVLNNRLFSTPGVLEAVHNASGREFSLLHLGREGYTFAPGGQEFSLTEPELRQQSRYSSALIYTSTDIQL